MLRVQRDLLLQRAPRRPQRPVLFDSVPSLVRCWQCATRPYRFLCLRVWQAFDPYEAVVRGFQDCLRRVRQGLRQPRAAMLLRCVRGVGSASARITGRSWLRLESSLPSNADALQPLSGAPTRSRNGGNGYGRFPGRGGSAPRPVPRGHENWRRPHAKAPAKNPAKRAFLSRYRRRNAPASRYSAQKPVLARGFAYRGPVDCSGGGASARLSIALKVMLIRSKVEGLRSDAAGLPKHQGIVTMTAIVFPFPILRRRGFVQKQAAHAALMRPDAWRPAICIISSGDVRSRNHASKEYRRGFNPARTSLHAESASGRVRYRRWHPA